MPVPSLLASVVFPINVINKTASVPSPGILGEGENHKIFVMTRT
jgi:hypothetical protein